MSFEFVLLLPVNVTYRIQLIIIAVFNDRLTKFLKK